MSTTATVAGGPATRTIWRRDAALLALGALLLRIPAFLAPRHLTFDDGQYGTVVLGMRAGDLPFKDLFSSQGPLYYPLLRVADLVGFQTLDGPRVLPVVAGAVAAVATYAIGRRITSRTGALLAGGLVATSGSVLYVTGGLSGDGPALAFSLTAVALAFSYRVRPSLGRAVAIGVVMGAALCVKLLVLPAAIPVGLILLDGWRRRGAWRDTCAAVGAALLVLVATVAPWGVDLVWDQSVAYHQDSQRLRSYGGNAWTIVVTLVERDIFVVTAAVFAVGFLLWRRHRGATETPTASPAPAPDVETRTAALLIGLWLGAQTLFLVIEPTMWRPHICQMIAPLALLAALRPAPWRVLLVVFLLLTPWWVINVHDILWPGQYSRDDRAVVDRLRSLPDGALVISDDPGFAWRAERRVPGNFVDVSVKRFQQRQITTRVIARAVEDPAVCAVVTWFSPSMASLPDLPHALERAGFEVVASYGGPRVVYERPDCKP